MPDEHDTAHDSEHVVYSDDVSTYFAPPGAPFGTHTFRCSDADWTQLELVAKQVGVARSEVVRVALQHFLKDMQKRGIGSPEWEPGRAN